MSSILDALNKLEDEKKEAARTAAAAAIDPRVAARELVGRGGARRPTHNSPLIWGLAGMAVFSLIALGAAAAAYFLVKPTLPPMAVAVATPAPVEPSAAEDASMGGAAAVSGPSVAPAVTAVATPDEPSGTTNVAASSPGPPVLVAPPSVPSAPADPPTPRRAAPESTTPPKPIEVASNSLPSLPWVGASAKVTEAGSGVAATRSVEAPAPVNTTPLPPAYPRVDVPPRPVAEPAGTSPARPAAREPMPDDISKLPMLRDSDKGRLGFENVKINMLQPKNDSRPYAKAIINLKPVLVGERIPDTRTTLLAVAMNGIAIEVNDSRERYFVSFGFGYGI